MTAHARKACFLLAFSLLLGCAQDIDPSANTTRVQSTSKKLPLDQQGPIDLKVVKYDALVTAIKSHRGSMVVVDIWGEFCLPCKQEFPHLVQMHHRQGPKGLVCISVSVDPANRRDAAVKFLREVGATFENYLLDEDWSFWRTPGPEGRSRRFRLRPRRHAHRQVRQR